MTLMVTHHQLGCHLYNQFIQMYNVLDMGKTNQLYDPTSVCEKPASEELMITAQIVRTPNLDSL